MLWTAFKVVCAGQLAIMPVFREAKIPSERISQYPLEFALWNSITGMLG
ncbi:hypothetical protein ACVWWO_006417 [Bradyrhizobium sp. F1.13.1]